MTDVTHEYDDLVDALLDAALADGDAQRAALLTRAAGAVLDLRGELDELHGLRERLTDILRRTAVALRGPEPPLTRWGWHDLPERAAEAVANRG